MQQINLYQAVLHPAREFLSLRQLAMACGAMLLLLVVVNLIQYLILLRNEQSRTEQQVELAALQAQVQQLQQQMQQRALENDADSLKTRLAQQDLQLHNKQQVLQLLSGRHIGNISGFAGQFTGLARQHVDGLWLTALYIHEGGEKLNLRGSTSTPELLPKYLQRLALEPSFHGIEFRTFLMQRAKDSSRIDFDLRSTADDKGN